MISRHSLNTIWLRGMIAALVSLVLAATIAAAPWIGVYTQQIDPDLAEAFDLATSEGVVIIEVIKDSPADKAGLQKKDIILKADGRGITEPGHLAEIVGEFTSGEMLEVEYIRDGKELHTEIEVGRRPADNKRSFDSNRFNIAPGTSGQTFRDFGKPPSYIGVGVQDLSEQLGEYFGVENGAGVLITEVFADSPAETVGLKAGDVIIRVDNESVARTSELQDVISNTAAGETVDIEFLRHGNKQTVTVKVAEDTSGLNAFSWPGNMPSVDPRGQFRRFKTMFFGDNDARFDVDEYRQSMREFDEQMNRHKKEMDLLREETRRLKMELRELKQKIDK